MYRRYENPHELEERLEKVKEQIAQCTDEGELEWLSEEKHDLEERINFAWQDDEYDEDYAREYYPEAYMEGDWR
jgi:hypothetical protein